MIGFWLTACGAASTTPSGPPTASLKPAGTGWYCVVTDGGKCFREQDRCAKRGPCTPQPIAWCVSWKENGDQESWCYRNSEECEGGARVRAKQPKSYSNVSTCGEWD